MTILEALSEAAAHARATLAAKGPEGLVVNALCMHVVLSDEADRHFDYTVAMMPREHPDDRTAKLLARALNQTSAELLARTRPA